MNYKFANAVRVLPPACLTLQAHGKVVVIALRAERDTAVASRWRRNRAPRRIAHGTGPAWKLKRAHNLVEA